MRKTRKGKSTKQTIVKLLCTGADPSSRRRPPPQCQFRGAHKSWGSQGVVQCGPGLLQSLRRTRKEPIPSSFIMSETDMKIDPTRASALISQLQGVSERVAAVAKGRAVCFSASFASQFPPPPSHDDVLHLSCLGAVGGRLQAQAGQRHSRPARVVGSAAALWRELRSRAEGEG